MPVTWSKWAPSPEKQPHKNQESNATNNPKTLLPKSTKSIVSNSNTVNPWGDAVTLELSSLQTQKNTSSKAVTYAVSASTSPRTLKVGSSGADVKKLQENLNKLGYNTGTPDGKYGNGTKTAVTKFQTLYGISADGIVGSGTQDAINKTISRMNSGVLSRGQISNNVKTLQNNLKTLGFLSGTPDGEFGAGTESAVKNFQKKYGLSQDGLVGSGTQNAIAKALAELNKPKPADSILKIGSQGQTVKELQTNLNALGFYTGEPDGKFGSGTEAQVIRFQKTYGLTADGQVGDSTKSAINTAINYKSKGILAKGQLSNDVKVLQSNLKTLGFLSGTADGAYGSGTETAVKNFQSKYGLTPNGVVDNATKNKINQLINDISKPVDPTPVNPSKPIETSELKMSQQGFDLLANYEVGQNTKGVIYDSNGKIISIAIKDIGDGKYTIGIGNTVDKNDAAGIQEYKDKYGIDVTKVGEQVNIATCMKIYNDHVNYYTDTVKSLLNRTGYKATQNEFEALVLAVYNRPALAGKDHALETLLTSKNRSKSDWESIILNDYKDNVSAEKWNTFNVGWRNRTLDEIELFFDNDYVRNH